MTSPRSVTAAPNVHPFPGSSPADIASCDCCAKPDAGALGDRPQRTSTVGSSDLRSTVEAEVQQTTMGARSSADEPPKPGWASVLRHPLVVGAGIAVISGVFAGVFFPALTRVWQDRPKELALKQSIVERISRDSTDATDAALFFGLRNPGTFISVDPTTMSPAARTAALKRSLRVFLRESSVIGSELRTYFPNSSLPTRWHEYERAMRRYFELMGTHPRQDAFFEIYHLQEHFGSLKFPPGYAENERRSIVKVFSITGAADLLAAERDLIDSEVVESNASGFSHGFWILG
jgi:hypothetical protein